VVVAWEEPDWLLQRFLRVAVPRPPAAFAVLAADVAAFLAVPRTALAASATLLPVLRAEAFVSCLPFFADFLVALRLRVAAAFFAASLR